MATAPSSSTGDSTQDYAQEFAMSRPWVRAEFGAVTHVGKVRSINEDQFLVAGLAKTMRVVASSMPVSDELRMAHDRGLLMVVADGMGGAAAGEHASALAVTAVEAFVLESLKWFFNIGGSEQNQLMREIRAGLSRVDQTLFDQIDANPALSGMGTTLTFAFSVGDELYIAHVGDSRAYLYRDGQLEQVTSDHTLAQMMVDNGLLTPEAARRDRRRNIITNVIGGPESGVRAEIHKIRLRDDDVILLCSDGLTDPVRDEQIAEALALHPNPDEACRFLLDQALTGGGPDNITVVIGRYQVSETPIHSTIDRNAEAFSTFLNMAESRARGDEVELRRLRDRMRGLGWEISPVDPAR